MAIDFELMTFHPVAVDSPDHIQPRCTRFDNSKNPAFNNALAELLGTQPKNISVLDFGCAGGGLVRSLISDGFCAVGLEGSDYNQKHEMHEWPVIPENLFTCDLGYPFTLSNGTRKPYQFDVITMWEFVEHVPMDRISTMLTSARRHLKNGGLVFGSTNDLHSVHDGVQHHLTIQSIGWWYQIFEEHGFIRKPKHEALMSKREAWVRNVKSKFVLQLEK